MLQPSQNNIKVQPTSSLFAKEKVNVQSSKVFCFGLLCWWEEVVINGATKEIGRAAIVAVSKARGMELAGAIDNRLVGQDAGEVLSFSF